MVDRVNGSESDQTPVKQILAVVMKSLNGRDGWLPVAQTEVPDWVKDPDRMARMVAGYMIFDPTIGEKGSPWYRLEVVRQDGETVQ